jgi:hypothetical protein
LPTSCFVGSSPYCDYCDSEMVDAKQGIRDDEKCGRE